MKITITDSRVNEKRWQKGERSGVIRTQEATAENARFRQVVRLDLGNEPAYEPGVYELDFEANVSVGQFGDFVLARRPTLVRVDKPAAQQPPAIKAAAA